MLALFILLFFIIPLGLVNVVVLGLVLRQRWWEN